MPADDVLDFMTPRHHAVRNFAVLELPRNAGRPLSPAQIANGAGLDTTTVVQLLDELESHLFFVVRDRHGGVSWAFPVTSDRTPHALHFSTGERIFGAWAEDALATPFVQGRLRKERLEVEIRTSCAHCGDRMRIRVDDRLQWRVIEGDTAPRVFLPRVDWQSFRGRNIIGDYWRNSVFFRSEEHVRAMKVDGSVFSLDEAAAVIGPAQAKLFGL